MRRRFCWNRRRFEIIFLHLLGGPAPSSAPNRSLTFLRAAAAPRARGFSGFVVVDDSPGRSPKDRGLASVNIRLEIRPG